jgi:hypothetical protein
MSQTVGKKELCAHLGWSRSRLDRVLERDPNFPVVSRGDQQGGWSFGTGAVDLYLARGAAGVTAPISGAAGRGGCETCRAVASALKDLQADVAEAARFIAGLERFLGECVVATEGRNGAAGNA